MESFICVSMGKFGGYSDLLINYNKEIEFQVL